jgi:hypothetical protein
VGNDVIGIEHLDVVTDLDVTRGDDALARLRDLEQDFGLAVHLEGDALEVQQNVDDILLHPLDRRVLVDHAADRDFGRRIADHRRQQDAAQRVAERMAVAALERLHDDLGVQGGGTIDLHDTRLEKFRGALHRVRFLKTGSRGPRQLIWSTVR